MATVDVDALEVRLKMPISLRADKVSQVMARGEPIEARLGGLHIVAIDPVPGSDLFRVKFKYPEDDVFVLGDGSITVYPNRLSFDEACLLIDEIHRLREVRQKP